MYNHNQKMSFIEETNKENMKILFRKIEEFENEKKKDIGEMTKEEFIELIYYLEYTNMDSMNTEVSQYQKYREWCVDKGISHIDCKKISKSEKLSLLLNVAKYVSYDEVLMHSLSLSA